MANAKLRTIIAAIKTRLAVPNGAGIYRVNTTAAGQVKTQLRPLEAVPAGATFPYWEVVPLFRFTSEFGPTNNVFLRHGIVGIIGYVSTTTATAEARCDAALDMLEDGMNALELDLTLGGLVRNAISLDGEVNGLEFDGSLQVGSCSWEYHFDYTAQIGAGT